jgi:hypothetical protein
MRVKISHGIKGARDNRADTQNKMLGHIIKPFGTQWGLNRLYVGWKN